MCLSKRDSVSVCLWKKRVGWWWCVCKCVWERERACYTSEGKKWVRERESGRASLYEREKAR